MRTLTHITIGRAGVQAHHRVIISENDPVMKGLNVCLLAAEVQRPEVVLSVAVAFIVPRVTLRRLVLRPSRKSGRSVAHDHMPPVSFSRLSGHFRPINGLVKATYSAIMPT